MSALRIHFPRHAVRHLPVLSEPDTVEQSLRGFFCLMVAFRAGVHCTGGCLRLNGPLPNVAAAEVVMTEACRPCSLVPRKAHELRRDTAHRQG